MKRITMMDLRKAPGEFIYHQVYRHNQEIIITHKGKDVAKIIPTDENWLAANAVAWRILRKSKPLTLPSGDKKEK